MKEGETMDLLTEHVIIKNLLRERKMDKNDMYLNDYKRMTIEEEKEWIKMKKHAKQRVKELEDMFPFAFGKYRNERLRNEFMSRFNGNKSGLIFL